MSHSHLLAATALLAAAFFSATNVFAHGRDDGPLFVAEDGTDSGSCTDESAPCGSLSYALGMAGKGSELRVAEGTYPVHNPEDLFHVVSGMIDVTGGFIRRGGHFAGRSGISTLTGVPPQFRDLLKDRGFHVVADRKAIEGPKVGQAERLISLHQKLKSGGAPASPCTDGMAGDLSCEAVDLLAHFSFTDVSAKPASATDVWGFLDLNTGREYAIVGYNSGTAVIDVTDPENLGEVDFIAGQPAGWRDIKVYQHFDDAAARWRAFAYVTTDGSTDGLFVIDMSGLPHSIRKTSYTSDFAAAHNAYLTNSDYGTGLSLTTSTPLLVIAGSNLSGGQYRSYSLANPASPEFVGGASAADYMHDASSAVIRDARKDSQCVNAVDWCEVLFDFNENTIDIWDVTEAENAQRLSSTAYENAAYVHSGWWSEDKRYLFVHDEQDEQHLGLNTNLRVFSISDLRSPVLVGSWEGPSRAIDHNGYTRGNRYYMSNYSRGLTVLDISDPASPVTAGSLDTYPFSDSSSFVGAWGTFPFFRSGTVAISDIDSGLYLTRDGSLEVPQGSFRFAAPSSAGSEGETVQLVVERSAGSEGHASVQYEVVHATADGTDYQLASATLQWPDKHSANR
ncbi:MAG: choice-of-anchor B family protein, partial [Woeseia sp.]